MSKYRNLKTHNKYIFLLLKGVRCYSIFTYMEINIRFNKKKGYSAQSEIVRKK